MVNAIAIDDEPLALDVLRKHSSTIEGLSINGYFTNPQQAIHSKAAADARLIFLDIRLKEAVGTDLAKQWNKDYAIIFTTAYTEYASLAFDLDAVDYLMKPISQARLQEAFNKYLKRYPLEEHILYIKDGSILHKILAEDIFFIKSIGNYVQIHTAKKTILHRNTLKDLLKEPGFEKFARTHKSYAVNLEHITHIDSRHVLLGDKKIPLSPILKNEFLMQIKK